MGLVVGATPNFLQSWCHKKTNQNLFGTFLPLMYLLYVTYTRMFFGKKKKESAFVCFGCDDNVKQSIRFFLFYKGQ